VMAHIKRMPEEATRLYAEHLALRVTRRGDIFTLSERYGDKKEYGTYRSLKALKGAIYRRHSIMLKKLII
jgi:hypothetical protein